MAILLQSLTAGEFQSKPSIAVWRTERRIIALNAQCI
jgi:hypothetical protein